MTEDEIFRILEDHNAILRNTHVVYTSGKHGNAYINKDALYPDTAVVSKLCSAIADHFTESGVDVVAAPAIGGVALSQWTAHHLSQRGKDIFAVYAEKQPDSTFRFGRGYDAFINGRRVLVVEDVLNTGGSVKAVVDAVRAGGGTVAGVAAISNRGRLTRETVGSPDDFFCLTSIDLEAWDEEACPLCKAGVPVNVLVGKGKDFVARKGRVA
jgi:orotate phosphoribosyltransferase